MGLYDYRFYLADESECRNLLYEIRWPQGIRCPACGHPVVWRLGKKNGFKYKCRSCQNRFTETSGTIFEKTRTPISKWICAIALFKIGISANQLKDEIRVTYKVAWQMLSKIRKAIKRDFLTDQLSGHMEVDETYFGGRRKGKRGRGAAGKTPVIGIIQRNGSVANGEWRYEDFFFQEFVPFIEKTYRIRAEKRYRAVAGLSMGGGGSFYYALHHPRCFHLHVR